MPKLDDHRKTLNELEGELNKLLRPRRTIENYQLRINRIAES